MYSVGGFVYQCVMVFGLNGLALWIAQMVHREGGGGDDM